LCVRIITSRSIIVVTETADQRLDHSQQAHVTAQHQAQQQQHTQQPHDIGEDDTQLVQQD